MSEKFVKNILDVPGVEGVCVIDKEGAVLYNELPSFFIEELFEDLARRIISLYETVDENFVPCDDYLLKFSERWIFLRRGNGIFILIFASPAVNRVSLKMVTNLAVKNLKSSKGFGAAAAMPPPSAVTPVSSRTPLTPAAPEQQPAPPAEPSVEPEPSDSSPDVRRRIAKPRPKRSFRGSSY